MDVVSVLLSKILAALGLCNMRENKPIDFLTFYNMFVERKQMAVSISFVTQ